MRQAVNPPPIPRRAVVLRALTAAGVLMSADIHLVLYFADGYDTIPVVGPMFLLNGFAGIAIGIALLLWRHWLPLLAAIGFGAATLLAFYVSATIGFFGVNETLGGPQQVLAQVSEWAAVLAGGAALAIERGRELRRRLSR